MLTLRIHQGNRNVRKKSYYSRLSMKNSDSRASQSHHNKNKNLDRPGNFTAKKMSIKRNKSVNYKRVENSADSPEPKVKKAFLCPIFKMQTSHFLECKES